MPRAEADKDLPQRAAHHHGHHARSRCAERHANSDFAGAAGDKVRHHAVKPHRGQDQRENAEETGELRNEPLLIEVAGHLRIERAQIHDGQIWVDAGQGVADQRIGILLAAA